jgi:hypothetical protein
MAALTDLALGLVTLVLARRLPREAPASRYWRATFGWAAVTALLGAVYHGILVDVPHVNVVTWAVMSTMVVVVMSFLLAASVVQVLGRGRAVLFWPLRSAGLLAYAAIAATGHPSIAALMLCESLTMASVLGLWIWAWTRRDAVARPMLLAIGVSAAAGLLRLVPGAAAVLGLDAGSAYHLGQIVGMVLLFRAAAGSRARGAGVAGVRGVTTEDGPPAL